MSTGLYQPADGVPINRATWGQVVANLSRAGVTIDSTPHGQYLQRDINGGPLIYPLPMNYSPESFIGNSAFESLCRNLQIDKHAYFLGWHHVL